MIKKVVIPAAGLGIRLLTTTSLKKKGTNNRRSRLLESKVSRRSRCREKVKFALGVTQIEDGTAGSYVIARPKGTTPLIGVVALEQVEYKVDPTTGKTHQRTPLML